MEMNFTQLRQTMVDNQIRPVNIVRHSVLSAFSAVPRERFVPENLRYSAYTDGDIKLTDAKPGQPARYMPAPAALARLMQAANISKNDFILDIGCTTGYAAVLLAHLGGAVLALESDEALFTAAERLSAMPGYENITVIQGDLTQGCQAQAPYDVIFLEGSVDFVPQSLFARLRENGRLIAVEGRGNAGAAYLYQLENKQISRKFCFNMALYPLPGFMKQEAFAF